MMYFFYIESVFFVIVVFVYRILQNTNIFKC